MGDQRAAAALGRIERALARIEAAAARPAPPPPPPPAPEVDPRLAAAHARLQGRVEAAIAEIDALLETAERG